MLRFFDLVPPAAEEFGDPDSSFGQTVIILLVTIGIWYAIGKWREGKD